MRIVHSIGSACSFSLTERSGKVEINFQAPDDASEPSDSFGIEGSKDTMVDLFSTIQSVLENISEVMKKPS